METTAQECPALSSIRRISETSVVFPQPWGAETPTTTAGDEDGDGGDEPRCWPRNDGSSKRSRSQKYTGR